MEVFYMSRSQLSSTFGVQNGVFQHVGPQPEAWQVAVPAEVGLLGTADDVAWGDILMGHFDPVEVFIGQATGVPVDEG